MVAPDRIDFGTIPVGTQEDRIVIATNLTAEPLVIEKIRGEGPFTASRTGVSLAAGASVEIVVTFAPRALDAPGEGRLVFETSTGARYTGATLAGLAGGPAELRVDPEGLSFGEVAIDGRAKGLITIRNRGAFDLEIESMSVPRPFAVEMAATRIPAGGSASVEVSYSPEDSGNHRANLMIRSNDLAHPRFVVPLKGQASLDGPDVAIAVDVEALDFGQVPVGGVGERWITIANRGTDPLNITSVTIPKPFAGSGKSRRIPVGKKLRLPVSFSPRSEGSRLEPLIIHSNDPNASFTIVSLLGEGAADTASGSDPIDPGSVVDNAYGEPRDFASNDDSGDTSDSDDGRGLTGPTEDARRRGFDRRSTGGAAPLVADSGTPGDSSTPSEPHLEPDPSGSDPGDGSLPGDDGQDSSGEPQNVASPSVDPSSGPSIGTHGAPGVQIGNINFDPTTGQLKLQDVHLPTIELPFGDYVKFQEVPEVTGYVTDFGDFETKMQIVAEGRDGVVYQGVIELKTGDQMVFTKSGPRSISGQALTNGSINIVGQIVIPPGPTAHNTKTMGVQIGLDNLPTQDRP